MRKIKINYVIGILFLIISIINWYKPNLLILIKDKIEYELFLQIILGILIILYPQVVKLLKDIYINHLKNICNRITLRGVFSSFCILLVIIKLFFYELVVDNISIYLILISMVIIFIPDLSSIFDRATKVKKGDFELELKELNSKVDKVEEDIKHRKSNGKLDYGGIDKDIIDKLELISNEPKALILFIATEIEIRLRGLIKLVSNNEYLMKNMYQMQKELLKREIITKNQFNLLNEFRDVRNQLAHGIDNNMTEDRLYLFADLGLRILETLPTNINEG